MKRLMSFALALSLGAAPLAASAWAEEQSTNPPVKLIGDLRWIGEGRLNGSTPLAGILAKPRIYGLGMVDGLRGEVLILDSQALIGEFGPDRAYRVRSLTKGNAAFLVYAEVARWKAVPLPDTVRDFAGLEAFVAEAAKAHGIDPDKPFPFRLSGRATALKWFVVDGKGNAFPTARDSFLRARYLGGLDDAAFDAVGFYSAQHRGVFTNPMSNIHVHFVTRGEPRFVGHLDDSISFAPGATLFLPDRLPLTNEGK